MLTGTLLRDMPFQSPQAALFFNRSPNKLVVACSDKIFLVDVSTQFLRSFRNIPRGAYYRSHALALSDDDALLVTGDSNRPYSACGYDTASCRRLWIHKTADDVGSVCMLSAHVVVTMYEEPTLVLDSKNGAEIATLQKDYGWFFGLGVVEGSSVFMYSWPHILPDLHTSMYLAMLQHLLYKQAKPLHLPLEMWDWITKYRV